MNKIRIAAVSYINTFPFLYGIEKSGILNGEYELSIDTPAKCAQYLINDKVDIGLVPVTVFNKLGYKEIVSKFCIGASGQVKSVVLLANNELNKLERIFLDYQSRTSALLVKVLAKFFWNIEVIWENTRKGFENKKLNENEGVIIIGDRVFKQTDRFKYQYDLALEWKNFTGLPFVFAAWIANKSLPDCFKNNFDQALNYGINHISDSLKNYNKSIYSIDLEKYLNENIDYRLNDDKLTAMNKFLELVQQL